MCLPTSPKYTSKSLNDILGGDPRGVALGIAQPLNKHPLAFFPYNPLDQGYVFVFSSQEFGFVKTTEYYFTGGIFQDIGHRLGVLDLVHGEDLTRP